MEQLDNQTVESLLDGLNGWQLGIDRRDPHQPNLIYKNLVYPNFAEAMNVAQRVVSALTGAEDHLGLSLYGLTGRTKVTLMFRTYREEGSPFGITEQDITLAQKVETVITETT